VADPAWRVALARNLIVYARELATATAVLPSIRCHHQQLSFAFATFWPGTGREDV